MKKILFALIPLAIVTSCKDYKPEMEQALVERDSVLMMSEAKDSSINAFLETLSEIETNLDSITQNQEAISMASGDKMEFNKDIRERINQNIGIINQLLEKNKLMLGSLNEKLRKSNINIGSLKKMIEQLNADIAQKDAELASLNIQLSDYRLMVDNLNRSMDSLNVMNQQKETVINDKTTLLNTAYWAIGNYKQLKASNILNKQGGFLGMGKEKVLKKDFNNDGFNLIDITKVQSFDINNKTAKIVTNHPSDSYTLQKDAKGIILKLEITDPTRFWKASKYLVIVTG
ncbi:MAG: hypothetical protein IPP71_17605 [Bacteroidetes bacterium]|nr:hypothetical protein [Bacteroidota bacterium]